MKLIVNFSPQKDDYCRKVLDCIDGEVINFVDLKFDFINYEDITDDIDNLYQKILKSKSVIYIIPNYSDYPCANFFLFNERGMKNLNTEKVYLDYVDIPKKFIVVGNGFTDSFVEIFGSHADEVEILYLNDSNKETFKSEIKKFLK